MIIADDQEKDNKKRKYEMGKLLVKAIVVINQTRFACRTLRFEDITSVFKDYFINYLLKLFMHYIYVHICNIEKDS